MYKKNDKTEFFPTSNWIRDILYTLFDKDIKTILDPCCGDLGLEKEGYDFTLLDLIPRNEKIIQADFLKWESNQKFDAVVVNPPFGLCDNFINKCFNFTDDIFIISPLISTINHWAPYIVDLKFHWKMCCKKENGFDILTSIGCFHLKKFKQFSLQSKQTPEFLKNKYFYPKTEKTIASLLKEEKNTLSQSKPFIVCRITKGRVCRGQTLIDEKDIHKANDTSIFRAEKSNSDIKKVN